MPLFRSVVETSKTCAADRPAVVERLRSSDSWEEVTADVEPGDSDEAAADVGDGQEREQPS